MESAMKIGDVVQVLDDNLEGVILRFQPDNSIVIETKDGFELIYNQKEVIKIASDAPKINFEGNLSKVLAEKEIPKKPGSVLTKLSKKDPMVFEVDLHLEKIITGKNQNLTNFDKLNIQLDEAKRAMDFAISKRYNRVVLIHGVGDGVLKSELEYLLRRYENIVIQEANYGKYGLGAMEIYIKQN
jgi:dsDNA-specific endonuclease/ATPase MutS2